MFNKSNPVVRHYSIIRLIRMIRMVQFIQFIPRGSQEKQALAGHLPAQFQDNPEEQFQRWTTGQQSRLLVLLQLKPPLPQAKSRVGAAEQKERLLALRGRSGSRGGQLTV
jgi:hypothetical protein